MYGERRQMMVCVQRGNSRKSEQQKEKKNFWLWRGKVGGGAARLCERRSRSCECRTFHLYMAGCDTFQGGASTRRRHGRTRRHLYARQTPDLMMIFLTVKPGMHMNVTIIWPSSLSSSSWPLLCSWTPPYPILKLQN